MNNSHNDQGYDLDVLANEVLEKSEPSQSADTDESTETSEDVEPTSEDSEEEKQEVQPENTLSEGASSFVENIAQISDEEKRQQKIKNLEKSGRPDQMEAAKVLREMYGGEPEVLNEDIVAQAVEKKLREMGVDPEKLNSQNQDHEKTARTKALETIISESGLDIDTSSVSKNIDFIKTFYDSKYKELDIEERTLIAFNKVNKKKLPSKSKTGGVPSGNTQVINETRKSVDDMDKRELDSFIYNATLEDFGIRG